jgi:hypothetical protein
VLMDSAIRLQLASEIPHLSARASVEEASAATPARSNTQAAPDGPVDGGYVARMSSPLSFPTESDSIVSIVPSVLGGGGSGGALEDLNYMTVGSQTDLVALLQQEQNTLVLDKVEYIIPPLFGK